MSRFTHAYHRLLLLVLGILVGVLIVPVTLQIISRYVSLLPNMLWTEEVARFCLIWMIMIGSVVAVREATHFDIDLLPAARSAIGHLTGQLIVRLAILTFGLIFLWSGLDYAQFGSMQFSEITEIRMLTIYIAYPLSALGWILFTIEAATREIHEYREAKNVAR